MDTQMNILTKIRKFINNNKPVRNCKLQGSLKDTESWKQFALVLYDYLGDNVIEILDNGHADKIVIEDGLVLIRSGIYIGHIQLIGNSRVVAWPTSREITIGRIVKNSNI